ncbi:diguanylate cyclase [Pseudomonas sp. AFG_SD02_1510_Pfu_092]|nr:diguanylate cyclase [Pseudomonas sp. AFG_SD02_1510_Pfu_092]
MATQGRSHRYGAIHRVACFAGVPAPTGNRAGLWLAQYLWERL